jgi:acetylornithine/N-succinyldiaminopimelate aminotransferase
MNLLFENKLLVVKASENVIRLLPPLTVNKSEIDEAISIIHKACEQV